MGGALWICSHLNALLQLKDGLELSFIDKSLFFEMISLAQPTSVPPISKLGLDALFEPVTVDEFTKSLSKKKIFIKALLLDQPFLPHFVSFGQGNKFIPFDINEKLCVIARNISPIDVITHVPIRCEEAGILYVCVPLKELDDEQTSNFEVIPLLK
ncbi:Uncharacterized protein TCM_039125 [Theobroma cacao]|uniref:Ribosomal protein eL8/eL30/eS12/Gadd45 domain-containing protein n=1 Tax=Theobroma cacao TaxID=3641 RepID=A0A061GXJ6_THECC|nr:Uncharacterized protein TCM_039125 [Theobroma cacao]